VTAMEPKDEELVAAVLKGETSRFEVIVQRYQTRLFGFVRRHARDEHEVEDIVQEILVKAFQKLASFRGDSPFENWLMRMATNTCIDYLRKHRGNREFNLTALTDEETEWLERFAVAPENSPDDANAARQLIHRVLEKLSPEDRMVITMMEIEDRPAKEVSRLTGWSVALVKVRAFRARAQMRNIIKRIATEKYL
jgi:RNA polymerase sigma-70 factor (ECF subfamily)